MVQKEPGKEVEEVVPSGKRTLIIPSGEEEERPRMAMVFRRVRAKEIITEKDKEQTEEEMIDQMHEQLMRFSRITRKKQVKVTECAMRVEEAERKAIKGDEAYQDLMME